MKKLITVLIILAVICTIGCKRPIGGDKDDHGCLIAAGYQWCPSRQECVRAWEDYCEELKTQFRDELVQNFEDCEKAGFAVMESYPRRCMTASGRGFTEILQPHEYCNFDNLVYKCGDYYKVIPREEGGAVRFYKDKTEIVCPVMPGTENEECEPLYDLDCGLSIC